MTEIIKQLVGWDFDNSLIVAPKEDAIYITNKIGIKDDKVCHINIEYVIQYVMLAVGIDSKEFKTDLQKHFEGKIGQLRVLKEFFGYAEKLMPKTKSDTTDIKKARHAGLITGLPDAYGRGRIIGDYRRIALYGIDYLMECKKNDWDNMVVDVMDDETMRLREEISMQYRALEEIKKMALRYGYDISKPAIIFDHGYSMNKLVKLNFADGTFVNMLNLHQFFDATLNKFVTITDENVSEFVGHKFAKANGDTYEKIYRYNGKYYKKHMVL